MDIFEAFPLRQLQPWVYLSQEMLFVDFGLILNENKKERKISIAEWRVCFEIME